MSRRMIYKGRNDNLDMLDDYVNEGRDPTYQDYRRISRSRSPYMKSPMSRFGPLNDDYYRNGRSRSPENRDSFPKLERVLKIPHEFVGYIIGNNGKVKQNIELLSGASLDCSNRNIDKKKFRSIFIYGTKDQVDLAECEVKKYLPIGEFSYFIDGLEFITDLNEKVHAISDKQAGLLKGYKGQTISDIQFNSGAVVGISKLEDSKVRRCKFYPDCKKGSSCEYMHPSDSNGLSLSVNDNKEFVKDCPFFPRCKFGDKCSLFHPEIPCKFPYCAIKNCNYSHQVVADSKKRKSDSLKIDFDESKSNFQVSRNVKDIPDSLESINIPASAEKLESSSFVIKRDRENISDTVLFDSSNLIEIPIISKTPSLFPNEIEMESLISNFGVPNSNSSSKTLLPLFTCLKCKSKEFRTLEEYNSHMNSLAHLSVVKEFESASVNSNYDSNCNKNSESLESVDTLVPSAESGKVKSTLPEVVDAKRIEKLKGQTESKNLKLIDPVEVNRSKKQKLLSDNVSEITSIRVDQPRETSNSSSDLILSVKDGKLDKKLKRAVSALLNFESQELIRVLKVDASRAEVVNNLHPYFSERDQNLIKALNSGGDNPSVLMEFYDSVALILEKFKPYIQNPKNNVIESGDNHINMDQKSNSIITHWYFCMYHGHNKSHTSSDCDWLKSNTLSDHICTVKSCSGKGHSMFTCLKSICKICSKFGHLDSQHEYFAKDDSNPAVSKDALESKRLDNQTNNNSMIGQNSVADISQTNRNFDNASLSAKVEKTVDKSSSIDDSSSSSFTMPETVKIQSPVSKEIINSNVLEKKSLNRGSELKSAVLLNDFLSSSLSQDSKLAQLRLKFNRAALEWSDALIDLIISMEKGVSIKRKSFEELEIDLTKSIRALTKDWVKSCLSDTSIPKNAVNLGFLLHFDFLSDDSKIETSSSPVKDTIEDIISSNSNSLIDMGNHCKKPSIQLQVRNETLISNVEKSSLAIIDSVIEKSNVKVSEAVKIPDCVKELDDIKKVSAEDVYLNSSRLPFPCVVECCNISIPSEFVWQMHVKQEKHLIWLNNFEILSSSYVRNPETKVLHQEPTTLSSLKEENKSSRVFQEPKVVIPSSVVFLNPSEVENSIPCVVECCGVNILSKNLLLAHISGKRHAKKLSKYILDNPCYFAELTDDMHYALEVIELYDRDQLINYTSSGVIAPFLETLEPLFDQNFRSRVSAFSKLAPNSKESLKFAGKIADDLLILIKSIRSDRKVLRKDIVGQARNDFFMENEGANSSRVIVQNPDLTDRSNEVSMFSSQSNVSSKIVELSCPSSVVSVHDINMSDNSTQNPKKLDQFEVINPAISFPNSSASDGAKFLNTVFKNLPEAPIDLSLSLANSDFAEKERKAKLQELLKQQNNLFQEIEKSIFM